MKQKIFAAVAAACALTACSHISGGASPSTMPLGPGSYNELGPVRGTDCVYSLFGVIPLSTGNETKKAISNAIAEKPGATALVKVSADTYSQFFILFGRTCTQVDGVAVSAK